jgi:hypothetical protein
MTCCFGPAGFLDPVPHGDDEADFIGVLSCPAVPLVAYPQCEGLQHLQASMRLVNHASELIHQFYQREKVEDAAQWRDAVQFPA